MLPSVFMAAKAVPVENTWVNPVPVGAKLLKVPLAPQDTSEPSERMAVKPVEEDQMSTKSVPLGPPVPPLLLLPQTAMLPASGVVPVGRSAAKAPLLAMIFV